MIDVQKDVKTKEKPSGTYISLDTIQTFQTFMAAFFCSKRCLKNDLIFHGYNSYFYD